jgi:hypothetical protein
VLLALLAGCGGGGGTTTAKTGSQPAPQAQESTAYVARANAICRTALTQTKALGKRFLRSGINGNPVVAISNELVRPGIAIRERMGNQMRALEAKSPNSRFGAYVELFDPLDSIARERLRAGLAGNGSRAHDLDQLMVDLGQEQKAAAVRAGIHTCARDFYVAAFGTSPAGP